MISYSLAHSLSPDNEDDFDIATDLINKHNAIQITKNKAKKNINQA